MAEKNKSGAGKFLLGATLGAIAGAIAGKVVTSKVEECEKELCDHDTGCNHNECDCDEKTKKGTSSEVKEKEAEVKKEVKKAVKKAGDKK